MCSFDGTGRGQLSLAVGDVVQALAVSRGWMQGTNAAGQHGIFPSSCVAAVASGAAVAAASTLGEAAEGAAGAAVPAGDSPSSERRSDAALLARVDRCLREWREAALRAAAAGDVRGFHAVKNRSSVLAEWRRRVAAGGNGGSHRAARDAALRLVEASRQIRGAPRRRAIAAPRSLSRSIE